MRTMYHVERLDTSYEDEQANPETRKEVDNLEEAVLIGSRVRGTEDRHWPVLDIDIPCELVPSTTDGHYHLYINHELDWNQYKMLLRTLAAVGILEDGYVAASLKRGQTFVRKPGLAKGEEVDVALGKQASF